MGSARAGNAIGGGDWAQLRLFPDIIRAWSSGESLRLRYPDACRPWQYVLEPLWGYLMLGARLLRGECTQGWNFGPDDSASVRDLLKEAEGSLGAIAWEHIPGPAEGKVLLLNSDRSRKVLGWENRLSWQEAVQWTAEDYQQLLIRSKSTDAFMEERINSYASLLQGVKS